MGYDCVVTTDGVQLFRRLLAAWRSTRDPVLEPLIDELGALLGRTREPLTGASEPAWHELARAKDPLDVERLFQATWPTTSSEVIARIRALGAFLPDPRIPFRLASLARLYPDDEAVTIHHATAAELRRIPTRRVLPLIDVIDAARNAYASYSTRAIYADAIAVIGTVTTTDADPDLIARARVATNSAHDLDELFAQVAADSGDRELHSVLADRLQSIGDPRGELIALQLSGAPEVRARIAELLEAHADAWTASLPGLDPSSRVFERGFLVAARVHLVPGPIARSLDRVEWSMIEVLSVTGDSRTDVAALIARMPRLRQFTGPRWAVQQLAAGGAPALRTLVVEDDIVPSLQRLPSLAVVLLRNAWPMPPFPIRALAERGLKAAGYLTFNPAILPQVIRTTHDAPPIELRFAFEDVESGWQVRIPPGRELAYLQHHEGRGHELESLIDLLVEAGLRRIVIAHGQARRPPRRRRGVEVELDGPPFDLYAEPAG